MTKWAFIFCIALLWASCSSILSSKPSGTLSEKQMTDILVDIHLTESTLKIINDSSARLNDTTYLRTRFAQVFSKNDVDPDDFTVSLDYYMKHIDDLDKIYTEVINRLTELEATLQPKPVENVSSTVRIRPGQNNIWFRSMNKIEEPVDFHYFGPMQYPVKQKVYYPEPYSQK
jgi:hypothetical protein